MAGAFNEHGFSRSDKTLYRHKLAEITNGRLDYLLDLTLWEMEFLRTALGNLLSAVARDRPAVSETTDG